MNKNIYHLLLALLAFTGLMSSCSSSDELVFDHERQQFETRADRILLEFIAPFGTTADEEIYITGAFNGDDEAIGDAQYLLTKAPNSNVKWGIYLDPSTFVSGKSLADGFRFYSKNQGKEFTTAGEEATHTDNPGLGTFTNIWGQRWESYYWSGGEQPEPTHDGFCVYVDDQTGWDVLTLYMWGDVNNLNGDWPGMSVTGTWNHDGITWKYFDMGEANTGLIENLIFNNGGGGQQLADFNFTIDRNNYLARQDADIVCLQEDVDTWRRYVLHRFQKIYPYNDTIILYNNSEGANGMGIHTRFPIIRREQIPYYSQGHANGSMAWFLKVKGDTVIVINNHLEGTHLSKEDRSRYEEMIKGRMRRDTVKEESMHLLGKLGEASAIRAKAAEAIHRYIEDHRQYPIIVCGDFNDNPISYSRRTVAKGLKDCYAETGRGIGLSYNRKGFYFRIDHILCSDHFEPYNCKIDDEIDASDHYPIYCWLKFVHKP